MLAVFGVSNGERPTAQLGHDGCAVFVSPIMTIADMPYLKYDN